MKRYVSLLLTTILCLNIAFASAISVNAIEYDLFDGYGSEKHPFLIKTADDVVNLSNAVNAGETYSGCYFVLTNDIDMSEETFRPIGEGANSFAGTFDGNLKTVSNVTVSGIGAGGYLGFFGTVTGTVKNLKISGITVSFANSSSSTRVSGVGGMAGNVSGTVSRSGVNGVSITNTVTSISEFAPGGFIGVASAGATVSDCYSINFTWNGSSNAVLGGFIGSVSNNSGTVTVKNCYAAGNFTRKRTPKALFAMGKVERNANLTRSNNYVSHGVSANMYSSGLTNIDIPATAVSASTMKNSSAALGAEFVADSNTTNGEYPKIGADATSISKIKMAIESAKPENLATTNNNLEIISDISLPEYALYGCKVSWSSLTPSVVSGSGVISDLSEAAYGKLVATFSLNGNSLSNTYSFKVGTSDLAKIRADINSVYIPDPVEDDFGLSTVGSLYGSNISWTSSNSAITIDENMARVTRPTNASGDSSVTLTATGTFNGSEYTKTFPLTVSAYTSDSSAVSAAKTNLTFDVMSSEAIDAVTQNLYLPETFGEGVSVTWAASPNYIANDGVIVRSTTNQNVTLTATLRKGSSTDTKTFNITLKAISNNLAKLQTIANALTFEKLSTEQIDKVTGNLTLPTSIDGGATVSWASSNTSVITTGGVVSRPAFCSGNEIVRLTATVALGGATLDKVFYVTVLEQEGNAFYLNENFESFSIGTLPTNNNFKLYGNTMGAEIRANPSNGSQKSLYLYKTSSMGDTDNGYTFRIPTSVSKGTIIFESNIYLNSMPEKNFRICAYTNIGTEITVDFLRTNSGADVYCGESSTSILSGRWYLFRLEIDTQNKGYYAYIDGVKINNSPATFAYADTNNSERLLIYYLCDFFWTHPTSDTHSVYMDNIKIFQSTSYGELLSNLVDKAELSMFKMQNIGNVTEDLRIPDGIEFESGDDEVISNKGKLLQEGVEAPFYLTSRLGSDPYDTSYTKEYNITAGLNLDGEGTEESPYIIETVAQLCKFKDEVNGGNSYSGVYFSLSNNLDLSEVSWTSIGDGTNSFNGFFDGGGHKITNVSVTSIGNGIATGLFGNVSGTIRNLGVEDIEINIDNTSGATRVTYAGGLVGNLKTGGVIDRCYVKDFSITNTSNANKISYSGGLVGQVTSSENPSISNSYVLNFTYDTAVSDEDSYVSGLIGRISSSSTRSIYIINSYVAGTFTSNNLYKYPTGPVSSVAYANSNSVYAAHGVDIVKSAENLWDLAETRGNHVNCGYISATEIRAASLLGDAFQADVDMLNGGFPMLLWENTDTKNYMFICTGIVEEDGAVTGVNIEKLDDTSVDTQFVVAIFSEEMLEKVLLLRYKNDFEKGANAIEIVRNRVVQENETVKVFVWERETMLPLMFAFEK